ncbi:MAG: metallophosphoesterase [Clostridia bacterium]|nr:metallophosphoesterase [Clostridia bacterium]
MALYVMADTHLSLSVDKPMDVFGGRWQSHAEKIKKNWEALVTEEDTVVIPGDLSWGMNMEEAAEDLLFLARLPGKKIFSRGNHDYFWGSLAKLRNFFASHNVEGIDYLQNNAIRAEGAVIVGSRGWFIDPSDTPREADHAKIAAREALRLEMSLKAGKEIAEEGEELIAFFHFPPVFGDFVCGETVALLKEYGVKRVYYGHIHGAYHVPPVREYEGIKFHIISADYLNFIPQRINIEKS